MRYRTKFEETFCPSTNRSVPPHVSNDLDRTLLEWTSPQASTGPRGRGATPLAWPGVRIAAERFRTRHTYSLRSRKPTGAEPEAQFDAITKRICVTPLAVKGDVAALLLGTTHCRLLRCTLVSVARKQNKIEFPEIRSQRCTSGSLRLKTIAVVTNLTRRGSQGGRTGRTCHASTWSEAPSATVSAFSPPRFESSACSRSRDVSCLKGHN